MKPGDFSVQRPRGPFHCSSWRIRRWVAYRPGAVTSTLQARCSGTFIHAVKFGPAKWNIIESLHSDGMFASIGSMCESSGLASR